MRSIVAVVGCIVILLTGCSVQNNAIAPALKLRNEIENCNGCAFSAAITADYGDVIYEFTVDCQTDKEGDLTFVVSAPETISGIAGNISNAGGALAFDGQALAFQTIADGLVTPITAPWILINTLKSGYIEACHKTDTGYEISASDSYKDNSLHLMIIVKDNLPVSGEIYWNGRRVLSVIVEDFHYL